MQQLLDNLLLNPDIQELKEILRLDPIFGQISSQVPLIMNELNAMFDINMPILDLHPTAVSNANQWISSLQAYRDKICQYEISLRSYNYTIERYWNLATNICMVQPEIESLRSGDHKKAYIETIFKDLAETKNYLTFSLKKLEILSDNIQQAYYNFSAQQKNVQMLATVHRSYGTPTN